MFDLPSRVSKGFTLFAFVMFGVLVFHMMRPGHDAPAAASIVTHGGDNAVSR